MPRARDVGAGVALMRDFRHRHAGGAVTQIDDDAAAGGLETRQRRVDRLGAAEHIADDVGAVQSRQYALAVADLAIDEGHVMHAVERRHIGIAVERPDLGGDMEFGDPLHQLVAVLPVGDQLGNRNLRELVLAREGGDVRSAHHGAVVFHQLGQHADRSKAGEPAKIDAGFGMARAHQHAALARHQWEHVAGAHEVGRAAVVVGQRTHGVAALLGRDAGGKAMAHVHRYGEGGAERSVVLRHHRIEMQAARQFGAERRADDARRVADDERHLFRRAERGGDEQIALVLAVVVVGDGHDLAFGEGFDRRFDSIVGLGHGLYLGHDIKRRA